MVLRLAPVILSTARILEPSASMLNNRDSLVFGKNVCHEHNGIQLVLAVKTFCKTKSIKRKIVDLWCYPEISGWDFILAIDGGNLDT
jgi:hypothetical protein